MAGLTMPLIVASAWIETPYRSAMRNRFSPGCTTCVCPTPCADAVPGASINRNANAKLRTITFLIAAYFPLFFPCLLRFECSQYLCNSCLSLLLGKPLQCHFHSLLGIHRTQPRPGIWMRFNFIYYRRPIQAWFPNQPYSLPIRKKPQILPIG